MNITLNSGLLLGLALIWPATAAADVCADIAKGGEVVIKGPAKTDGCTATLTKDTIINGEAGKLITGPHGVLIKLNGHRLTVAKLNVDFEGDFALAVHGDNKDSDLVTFSSVKIVDKTSADCGAAATRVGVVLWKVKTATIDLTAANAKVRHGLVVGAPMVTGDHKPPEQLGTATVTGGIAYCPSGAQHGKTAILAFERAVTWTGGEVGSVGPCDFEDPTLRNLRDLGLPGGVPGAAGG